MMKQQTFGQYWPASWPLLQLLCMLAIDLLSRQLSELEFRTVRAPCCDVLVPTTLLLVTRSISEPLEISVASALRSPDEHSPLETANFDHLREQ